MKRGLVAFLLLVVAGVVVMLPGCGADTADTLLAAFDAGADAPASPPDADTVDPTLGGPCSDDAQCNDDIPCTFDACDRTLSRCRNTPDDAQCGDGVYCNGKERCVVRQGCLPGPVVACSDDSVCTIDHCVEATQTCTHADRDVDGDGDPDGHCRSNTDCDDLDPTVNSKHSEVCGNFKDDNCNGEVDESPCATAANDTCATALAVNGPGTFLLSTVAAAKDYAVGCDVTTPAAAHDIVVAITVPSGAKDVRVRALAHDPDSEVAVSLAATCGVAGSCGHIASSREARAIARGTTGTVYAILTTQAETNVDLTVEMLDPTTRPTNESCAAPAPVAVDAPIAVSLVDAARDLASTCTEAKTGELTYAFTLTEPHDVRIFATTTLGEGTPVISLRSAGCTAEKTCRAGLTPPVFARSLGAGAHVFSVAATSQIDASVVVRTYPPTTEPATGSCGTAPEAPTNTTFQVDLGASDATLLGDCLPGAPSAAYQLTLATPSDVLVVGRFVDGDTGAVAVTGAGCPPAELSSCRTAAMTSPLRVEKRNLPAGSYRVLVGSKLGMGASLTVLVRPTVAPVVVTSDGCVAPQAIPPSGGFFTGDTTNAAADFSAGCDSPGVSNGGANDHLLQLVLPEKRRVFFDLTGSRYTTLLDVRGGAACPGVELATGCASDGTNQAFRDLTLEAGTYFVQVDGYGNAVGEWNLDVRVVPP